MPNDESVAELAPPSVEDSKEAVEQASSSGTKKPSLAKFRKEMAKDLGLAQATLRGVKQIQKNKKKSLADVRRTLPRG